MKLRWRLIAERQSLLKLDKMITGHPIQSLKKLPFDIPSEYEIRKQRERERAMQGQRGEDQRQGYQNYENMQNMGRKRPHAAMGKYNLNICVWVTSKPINFEIC